MILIEHNGETMLVASLAGYEGCAVIEADVPPPPSEFCRRAGGRWVEDAEARSRAERQAELSGLSRAELVERIEAMMRGQQA